MNYQKSQEVAIYTPSSRMNTPGLLLRTMLHDLINSHELAWQLFVRDIAAQYRQTLLGIFWAFVPPLVTSMVFIVLQSRNIVNFGTTDIPYPVFVIIGTLLWQLFTESLNAPLKTVTAAKPLLIKINFPREALIVSSFYVVLFNSIMKIVIVGVVLLIFDIPLTWGLALAPLVVLMLIILGICIGLLLTPLGLLYTDVANSIPIVMQLFFFITPVVYPAPQTYPFSLIATVNPVSPILSGARDLITQGVMTNLPSFALMSGLTFVFLLVAWVLFRVALPIVIERIGA